jgi:hypothetical protein
MIYYIISAIALFAIYTAAKLVQLEFFSKFIRKQLQANYDLADRLVEQGKSWKYIIDACYSLDIDASYDRMNKSMPWNYDFMDMLRYNR